MNKSKLASQLVTAVGLLSLLGCSQTTLAARLVDVNVVNSSTGERLKPYAYDGKFYVAGKPGDRYRLELRSPRGERVLTVVSVDGVNVLTGQTAATLQSGYVIDGGLSYSISGWRKSMDDVAQFVFTELPNSYAARTGRPGNVGVIGLAVYRERPAAKSPMVFAPPAQTAESSADGSEDARQSSAPAPSLRRETQNSAARSYAEKSADSPQLRGEIAADKFKKSVQLGTGHGDREYSPMHYTDFVRNSDTPDEIITLYYDSRVNLIARGIIPPARFVEPTPFPAVAGFVPDPQG